MVQVAVVTIGGARLVDLLGDWRVAGNARDRLVTSLRGLILDAQISLETRLPSERALAAALGVSRSTVTAAYDQLRAEGYLRSTRGSGSFAAVPGGHRGVPGALASGDGIDLRIAALPAPPILGQLVESAAADLPRWLDHHGYDPLGLPPLRRAIAARFTARGLPTRPEQILVTNGALQALDLTVRGLAPRGRSAIVEVPTYPAALDVLRCAHTRLRFVPVTAEGWDIDALEASLRGTDPALAYLTLDFQNPTGAVMDVPTRRRVLDGLARCGGAAVIDETFAELCLGELEQPPPAAGKGVIILGSLSKAAWGGLRIGWARAEPSVIARLATARGTSDMASPALEQLVALQVMAHLDEILAERRVLLQYRYDTLARALADQLPHWRWSPPAGGLVIWAELDQPISTSLAIDARRHGVHLTPGPRFGAAHLLERFVRLPFTEAPDRLERAIMILAQLDPKPGSITNEPAPIHYVV